MCADDGCDEPEPSCEDDGDWGDWGNNGDDECEDEGDWGNNGNDECDDSDGDWGDGDWGNGDDECDDSNWGNWGDGDEEEQPTPRPYCPPQQPSHDLRGRGRI